MSAGKTATQVGIRIGVEVGTRVALGWTSEFAIEKLREMGLSSGEIFLVNIIGNIVASRTINKFANTLGSNSSIKSNELINVDDWLRGMSPEDAVQYSQRMDILDGVASQVDGFPITNGKVLGKIPLDEYLSIRDSSIHNAYSDSIFLGIFYAERKSHIEFGKYGGFSYFDLGDGWGSIQGKYNLNDDDMFDLFNKLALEDEISSGRKIKFSHNPGDPAYLGSALDSEWQYLKEKYNFKVRIPEGGGWIAK